MILANAGALHTTSRPKHLPVGASRFFARSISSYPFGLRVPITRSPVSVKNQNRSACLTMNAVAFPFAVSATGPPDSHSRFPLGTSTAYSGPFWSYP